MVVGCALDPSSRGIPCSEAAAEQRIGTDEVHADGRGPSPLNSVLYARRGPDARTGRVRGSTRMSKHRARVAGPELRSKIGRVVGVAGPSTWATGIITRVRVVGQSTRAQPPRAWREASQRGSHAACPRRGFTTARSSASAKERRRASGASPHPRLRVSQHGVRLRERPQSGRLLQ